MRLSGNLARFDLFQVCTELFSAGCCNGWLAPETMVRYNSAGQALSYCTIAKQCTRLAQRLVPALVKVGEKTSEIRTPLQGAGTAKVFKR